MKIIALSRQIGSWGDEIAAMVAERLGFQLVDQKTVHELAESCDPGFKDACELYEREAPKGFWERFFFNKPANTSLFEALNFELASRGDVVLVGRGSQVVLLNIRGVLRARIVAPTEVRVKRFAEQHGVPEDKARDYVVRHGQQRRALIQNIWDVDLSDWALYDLIVNTQDMTPDDGAYIVACAAQKMQPVKDEEALKERLKRLSFAKLVESAIRKELTGTDLGPITVVSPSQGRVVIAGVVSSEADKLLAGKIAGQREGVTEVDNQLRVIRAFGV
ncbi:MAG: cytidylate kinase family protein [Thermodesulfobacteriota bacterium]